MNMTKAQSGAEIIINKWLGVNSSSRMLIVTDVTHTEEAQLLKDIASQKGCKTDIFITGQTGKRVGIHFDENPDAFRDYDVIIGATDYSLVTTLAAKRAITDGKSFLSLPLHTNDGRSMLEYDFLHCNTQNSKAVAEKLVERLHKAGTIHVTTQRGTDLYFYKKDRHAKFFNGNVKDCDGYSSASIEVYVPVQEDKTHGTLCLDGSYGYIGRVKTPFMVTFDKGRITDIEEGPYGKVLKDFIEDYDDDKMYTASEFGIGLNPLSRCDGNCYIEDESALGTFHIGLGRNLALGGIWEASGHFDLTTFNPDVYADSEIIIKNGKII